MVDINITPEMFRQIAEQQEEEWRQARKALHEMGLAEELELDEDEEERKSAERMALLDTTLATHFQTPVTISIPEEDGEEK